MNDAVDVLTQRLEGLEREARRWRVFGSVALAVLGLFALLGAAAQGAGPVADEIRARRLVLVDAVGKARAKLDVDAAGRSGLRLYDQAGKVRAVLAVKPDGSPVLRLSNEAGRAIFRAP